MTKAEQNIYDYISIVLEEIKTYKKIVLVYEDEIYNWVQDVDKKLVGPLLYTKGLDRHNDVAHSIFNLIGEFILPTIAKIEFRKIQIDKGIEILYTGLLRVKHSKLWNINDF